MYEPKVKLKALHWDKLNEQSVESSLWSKLGDHSGLNETHVQDTLHKGGAFERLERMFASKQAVDIQDLREKQCKEREAKENTEISVLDPRRAHSINIMLGMMKKFSFRDIRLAILRMDTEVITDNVLKQLLAFLPTPEERELLAAYEGQPDCERLSRPDRFFLEIMKIWRYEQRLRVMATRAVWSETLRDLKKDVASIMDAANAVASSSHFAQVLEIILTLGNYMNGPGFRGGAYGFKLASLNKLVDTKAVDNKTTLLHFVAQTVEEHFADSLEFLKEFKTVDSGCRTSLAETRAEIAGMRARLAEAKRELELLREKELKESTKENNNEEVHVSAGNGVLSLPNDKFVLSISRFVTNSTEQFEALLAQFTAMEEAYRHSVLVYGENPRSMTSEEFFGIFKTFTSSFSQALRDNKIERERKHAAEKRRKQIEIQVEQRRLAKQMRLTQQSSTVGPTSAGESHISELPGRRAGANRGKFPVDMLFKPTIADKNCMRDNIPRKSRPCAASVDSCDLSKRVHQALRELQKIT
ncbi:hypothetical protein GGI23_002817 [Coemansia sp. RSA 2559]|nr:hypothetical protein GGI23_002817 [Coemansia sp. RSA 2559]